MASPDSFWILWKTHSLSFPLKSDMHRNNTLDLSFLCRWWQWLNWFVFLFSCSSVQCVQHSWMPTYSKAWARYFRRNLEYKSTICDEFTTQDMLGEVSTWKLGAIQNRRRKVKRKYLLHVWNSSCKHLGCSEESDHFKLGVHLSPLSKTEEDLEKQKGKGKVCPGMGMARMHFRWGGVEVNRERWEADE